MRGNTMDSNGLTSAHKIGLGLWIYPQKYAFKLREPCCCDPNTILITMIIEAALSLKCTTLVFNPSSYSESPPM